MSPPTLYPLTLSLSTAILTTICPPTQEVTALIRPASLTKPKTLNLQNRGVTIVPYDTSANAQQDDEQAIQALHGIDVVIAAVGPDGMESQIALATAAKAAGVQRFVPSFFATAAPPRGVVDVRGKVRNGGFSFLFVLFVSRILFPRYSGLSPTRAETE